MQTFESQIADIHTAIKVIGIEIKDIEHNQSVQASETRDLRGKLLETQRAIRRLQLE